MATYSTPYKEGTVTAFFENTLSISGFVPAASDVGRLLIITSGAARLQHREIIGVSGQSVTLAHSLNSNPFIDPTSDQRASDVDVASGDSFVVSYLATDLVATDAQMTSSGNNNILINGPVVAQTGAYIFFKDSNVEGSADDIQSGRGGGFIFGYYGFVAGEDGYIKHACNLVITGGGTSNPFRISATSFGLFDMYGGNMYIPSATPFGRFYENTERPDDTQTRIMFVDVYGNLGGRVGGNRSMLVLINQDSTTTFGIFNPRATVARVEFSAIDCDQGGYVFTTEAPEGRAVFPRIVNVRTRLLRVTGANPASLAIYEVVAKKNELDTVPAFFNSTATLSNHIVRYGNLIRPKMILGSGASVTGSIKTRMYDNTGAFIEEQTITNGAYTELFARHTDVPTVTGDRTLADGTQYAPYSLRMVQAGKQFTSVPIDAEDTFESNVVMLDDASFTAADKAAALAATPNTTQSVYNFAVAWLEDNITDETGFIFSLNGDTLVTTYDVVIDAGAPNDIALSANTVTLKAFTGKLTANSITVVDGTSINGNTFNDVNLTTATDLSNVTVTGTMTFNDDVTKTVTFTDSIVNVLVNDGTGDINVVRSNSTVADETDAEVTTSVAPTPSTMTLTTTGRWALYDNNDAFVESGVGNKTVNHVGGTDTGTWSIITHNKGSIAEQYSWVADDGSTNNFTHLDTQLIRPEGGPIFSDGPTTDITVAVNANNYVEVNGPNVSTDAQVFIDAIQNFLNTDAGLDHMRSVGILNAPIFGTLNGITYFFNVEGYQLDSIPGITPEAGLSAVLVSSASHANVLIDNGGLVVVASAESLTETSVAELIYQNSGKWAKQAAVRSA